LLRFAKYYHVRTVIPYPCQEIQGRPTGPTFGWRLLRAPNLHQVYRGRNSLFVKLTGNCPCIYHAYYPCRLSVLTNRYLYTSYWHHASLLLTRDESDDINPGKHTSALVLEMGQGHEKPLESIHIRWTPVLRPRPVTVKFLLY